MLEVTSTDDGSIQFPSITICKDEMFDQFNGLMKRLQSGGVLVEDARSWFREAARKKLIVDKITKWFLKITKL